MVAKVVGACRGEVNGNDGKEEKLKLKLVLDRGSIALAPESFSH